MIKNIGVLVILVLIVIASYIVISKSANPGGKQYAADIESLNKFYQSPANYAYTHYVTNDVYDAATSAQKKYIAAHAVVVNKDEAGNVARLKELEISNIPAETIATDTAVAKIDSIYELRIEHNGISGDVDLSADEVLYFPTAHDERWHVVVDITDLKPFKANDGRMGIFIEKGRHHIALVYKLRLRDKLVLALEIIGLIGLFFLFLKYNYNSLLELTLPQQLSPKNKIYAKITAFTFITIIIYFYFLKWKTGTAYGDDLYGFNLHWSLHSFSEQLNIPQISGKYRPISSLIFNSLIILFRDNLYPYYIFNVIILSINTYLCFLILYPFLRSYRLSFLFAITFGLSRFFYYEISQLLNGGALEGIAMTWFLCFLWIIVNIMMSDDLSPSKKYRQMLLSILFANACIYTHERYISIFLFILALVFLSRSLKDLPGKQKVILAALAIFSPLINIFIKTQIYLMPFLLGTSDNAIQFSFLTPFSFFTSSILSLFQVNKGPNFCFGISFPELPVIDKVISLLIALGLAIIIFTYVYRTIKSAREHATAGKITVPKHLSIFGFLALLLMLCIGPCLFTVRLEHRWLAAPLAIFTLMIAIALTSFNYRTYPIKYGVFLLLISGMLWINFSYLDLGIYRIFMRVAEIKSASYKDAMNKNIIRKDSKKLYIWERLKNVPSEDELKWTLAHGYFFKFYGAEQKQMLFIDSTYIIPGSSAVFIPDFDAQTSQIILPDPEPKDLTAQYLRDSLRSFVKTQKRKKVISKMNHP